MTGRGVQEAPRSISRSGNVWRAGGQYGERRIFMENGKLCYQRGNGIKHELTPMTNDTFRPATLTDFRLRFDMEGGKVVAVTGLYEDGRMERNEKNPRP